MHTPDDLRYDLALIGAQAKFQNALARNVVSDLYPGNELYGKAEVLTSFFNDIYSTLQDRSDSDFVTDAPF